VLVHVHTPFAGSVHERELRALAAARPSLGSRLIVCGDFNTVSWAAQFQDFSRSTGLTDVFRGAWHAYSWPSWSRLLGVPLDHCLISSGLAVRERHFGPSIGSDHFPLVVDVAILGKPA
jgi:endonuclease/exonuclease/phosphatase (EEP) superfamily protein YafD